MVVKAEEVEEVEEVEEQKKLTAESGSVNPSINESDIINIVKEVEKDIQKQKERTN
jgi:DNA-binding TFAR19-related protein (PDSD5 family)